MPSTKIDSPDVEPQPQVENVIETTSTKKPVEEKKITETRDENDSNGANDNVQDVHKKPEDKIEEKDEELTNGNKENNQDQTEEPETKEEKDKEDMDGSKRKSISNEGETVTEVIPKKLKTDSESIENESEDVTSSA